MPNETASVQDGFGDRYGGNSHWAIGRQKASSGFALEAQSQALA